MYNVDGCLSLALCFCQGYKVITVSSCEIS